MELTPFKHLHRYLQRFAERKLWVRVLVAMLLGIVAGVAMGPATGWIPADVSATTGNWLAMPGTLFLKLVQMIMIPLIVASIITGIATSGSTEQLKKLGSNVLLYFVLTTSASVSIGLGLVYLLKPGNYFPKVEAPSTAVENTASLPAINELPGIISNLLPENPLTSMVTGEMLSIVIFSVIIGVALTALRPATAEPILRLLRSVQEVCMIVVKGAMRLVPLAVFGMMAQLSSSLGLASLAGVGMYVLTVGLGLALLLGLYLGLVRVLGKQSPGRFLQKIREVQLLAFSTTSSAAVMPLSMKVAEEKLNVQPSISGFLIPIGSTINMDGTALYQCVSAVFLAQVYGIELGLAGMLLMLITIVAASIGTPSIPGGGVVVMAAILQGIGVPAEGIVLIIGVERILGMFRTAINVTGDLAACTVFDRWSREQAHISNETSNSSTHPLQATHAS